MCVQNFDDSRGFAIRMTYRISLRSSSLWEPRHPLLTVVLDVKSIKTLLPRGRYKSKRGRAGVPRGLHDPVIHTRYWLLVEGRKVPHFVRPALSWQPPGGKSVLQKPPKQGETPFRGPRSRARAKAHARPHGQSRHGCQTEPRQLVALANKTWLPRAPREGEHRVTQGLGPVW